MSTSNLDVPVVLEKKDSLLKGTVGILWVVVAQWLELFNNCLEGCEFKP